MGKKLNLKEGDKINYLTLLQLETKRNKNGIYGLWKCDCGNEKVILNSKVMSGWSKSCSCYQKTRIRIINTIHNCANKHNETVEYQTWQNMKDRCNNPNNKDYKHYGERGIIVCNRWLLNFENFLSDMGNRPSIEYSIDRTNTNGNYEPSNCQWIKRTEQVKNRRTSILVEYCSTVYCLKDICKILNLRYPKTLYNFRKNNFLPQQLKLINDGRI